MFYFIAVLLLAVIDMVATHYQVTVYGTTDVEANPLMRYVMETWGMFEAYCVRITSVCIGMFMLMWAHLHSTWGIWALRLMFTAHLALVAYHFYITNCFTIHLG